MISLATIMLRVLWQGFWGEGATHWSERARVSTNILVRDLDLVAHNNLDGRRLEVVADGLTLWLKPFDSRHLLFA